MGVAWSLKEPAQHRLLTDTAGRIGTDWPSSDNTSETSDEKVLYRPLGDNTNYFSCVSGHASAQPCCFFPKHSCLAVQRECLDKAGIAIRLCILEPPSLLLARGL